MPVDKFDRTLAQRPVKLIRSPRGDKYNIRTMMARGLKHEVAVQALEKIRAGEVEMPDAYAWSLTKNPNNLDPAFIARKQTGQRLIERMYETIDEVEYERRVEEQRLETASAQDDDEAFAALPDLIRDDEVMLPPKSKRRRGRPRTAKPKWRRTGPHPTPARDRVAREEMARLLEARR